MLDQITYELIKKHRNFSTTTARTAVCLGDQKPSFGSGHETIGSMFKTLGYDRTLTLDYDGKADILHNLNQPLPREYYAIADVVYDGGTSEHVANIGESLTTMVRLPKIGGLIVQVVPINCYGGSYYGLDPLLLHDFYRANGFEQKELFIFADNSWRFSCIRWATRNLPAKFVEAVRLRLQKTKTAKTFVLKDVPKKIYEAAPAYAYDGKFNDVPIFRHVPTVSLALYAGVKREEIGATTWPAQRNYPNKV